MKKKTKIILVILLIGILVTYVKEPRYFKPSVWATASNAEKMLLREAKEFYGKEFKILYLERRTAPSGPWYEGKAILKEKIGTEEESEFTFSASSEIEGFFLGEGGIGYGAHLIKVDIEKYFEPKLTEIFEGKAKIEQEGRYVVWDEDEKKMNTYLRLTSSFQETLDRVKSDPRNSMQLIQDLYIFEDEKNLDNIAEYKEKIFKYKEYLEKEGLLDSMKVYVRLINNRVLLNDFKKIYTSTLKETKEVGYTEKGYGYYLIEENSKKEFLSQIKKAEEKAEMNEKQHKLDNFKFSYFKVGRNNILLGANLKYGTVIVNKNSEDERKNQYIIFKNVNDVNLKQNKDTYIGEN